MTPVSGSEACAGGHVLLAVCLVIACGFELVNGFHDAANAVATVIHTRTLRPTAAVVWSGLCTFAGVQLGGVAVAMTVIKLLPAELAAHTGHGAGLAMLLALLLSAIVWNLGTWSLGLPASSTHTLIGAITGVGLANSLRAGHTFGAGICWRTMQGVVLSLVLSPLLGLSLAALLALLARKLLKNAELHRPPTAGKPPPWIRAVLIGTCAGVSVAHGSNDGQKGVGLIMLILMGLLPADFALDRSPPAWVLLLVATSLGAGTMLGWRRITATMCGKIGKSPLTYAQSASAQTVAAVMIGASACLGLPVSTTHVLSSGIAGTMLAGKSGVQWSTVRSIALTWVLTLPVAMVLAGGFFLAFLWLIQGGY